MLPGPRLRLKLAAAAAFFNAWGLFFHPELVNVHLMLWIASTAFFEVEAAGYKGQS